MSNPKDLEKLPIAQSIRRKIDAILGSDTARKALAEYERKSVATRAELVARLQAVPGQYADRQREAVSHAENAARNLQDAKDRMRQCNDEYQAAALTCHGLELSEERAKQEIIRELRQGADHRLADYIFFLDCLREELLSRLHFGRLHRKSYATGERTVIDINNIHEIFEVRIILDAKIKAAKDWQLEALTQDEVTERLHALSGKLERPLDGFELKPPRVQTDEILAPDVPLEKLRTSPMPSIAASKQ